MSRPVRNYLWRKHVRPAWLAAQEPQLRAAAPAGFAAIEKPGARTILLECFCARSRDARRLRKIFGGQIVALPGDWRQRLFQSKRQPLGIGARLTVVEAARATELKNTLVIPAAAAFGTGEHTTTAMCLRMLERRSRNARAGWSLLDLGTGSGILALAARRFGAAKVVALENDPLALSTAVRNGRRNRLRDIEFLLGDVTKSLPSGRFDFITANLFHELLVKIIPRMPCRLSARGELILSGIMRPQLPDVVRALQASGFESAETRRRGKWIALRAFLQREKAI